MALEIERKYLGVDFDALRNVLTSLGARSGGLHFESNLVFDTQGEDLVKAGKLLRLRTMQWRDVCCHVLTLKMPAQGDQNFKRRDEFELEITDPQLFFPILNGLGFECMARYEKFRESWHVGKAKVELDSLPFADVVEIEGDESGILATAKLLALDKSAANIKSYHELHQEWLQQQGLPPQHSFVFSDSERNRLNAMLAKKDGKAIIEN